jgi:hypothetical protein
VPDVDDGAGYRIARNVEHLAVHEQDLTLVRAVVETRLALHQRRTGDIERTFDSAGRAAAETGAALGFVETEIKEVLERGARHHQAQLIRLGCLANIGDRAPELVHGYVEIVDGDHDVVKQAVEHLLDARVALIVVQTGGPGSELLDGGLVD